MNLAPNIRLINDNNLQDYLLSGEVGAAFIAALHRVTQAQGKP